MKRAVKLFGLASLVSTTGMILTYPELKFEGRQLFNVGLRLGRITASAIEIGLDYQEEITSEKHFRNARKLSETLIKNGGTYIKCGQAIAQLDHMFPTEYRNAMKPMFAEASQSSFDDIQQTIYEELGQPIEAVFKEFDRMPLTSTPTSQVHRAVLMDGTEVAVKVQHRWIKRQYLGDIRVLEFLVTMGSIMFPSFNYLWFVKDLKLCMAQELDFALEERNINKFREIFKNDPRIEVPKIYMQHSSNRLLTMDYVKGIKLSDLEISKANGIFLLDLASTLTSTFNQLIFEHGFVNCDPQNRNILVKSYKYFGMSWTKIVIQNIGNSTELSRHFLNTYKAACRSMLLFDPARSEQLLASLAEEQYFHQNISIQKNFLWLRQIDEKLGNYFTDIASLAYFLFKKEIELFKWLIRILIGFIGLYKISRYLSQ